MVWDHFRQSKDAMFGLFLTGGDIFPNASDRDGRTFDPIPVGVFNYSLDSSMDLF